MSVPGCGGFFTSTSFLIWIFLPTICLTNFVPWSPPSGNRTDLLCDQSCLLGGTHDNFCCYCNSKALWEMDDDNITSLFVEYDNPFGANSLFIKDQLQNTPQTVYRVLHTNGYMSALPQNICEFIDIVEIDFSGNSIRQISNISCLVNLEKLRLRSNKITVLLNTTFSYNTKLRELDVSQNMITELQPNTFVINGIAIYSVNVSNTHLEKLDVSNLILETGFCSVDYDNSPIEQFTNLNGFMIDTNKAYGGHGDILMRNCSINSLFNMTDIGIPEPNLIRKCFEFSIETDGLELTCDCLIEPFLSTDLPYLQRFLPELARNNISCKNPAHLRQYHVENIVLQPSLLDLLVCEKKYNCPKNCQCFDQPSQGHFVVNCSNAGLTSLPDKLPWGSNYSLFLDGNSITELGDRDYLTRVSLLDISNNPFTSIPDSVASTLPVDAEIKALDNNLNGIPKIFQHKKPSTIILGDVYMDCTCDNIWMSDWLNLQNSKETKSTFYCKNRHNSDVRDMNENVLDCLSEEPYMKIAMATLAILSLMLIVALILFTCCRPEIYLIKRQKMSCKRKHCKLKTEYDATIYLDENDKFQLLWAKRILLPYLEMQNTYSVYFPPRDEAGAVAKEESLQFQVNNSRAYIFLVSENSFPIQTRKKLVNDFEDDCWASASQSFRFSRIWRAFVRDKDRKLIVINFDNMKTSDINNRMIRAFLRVRECINFTDRHGNILHKIKSQLGEPDDRCVKHIDYDVKKIYIPPAFVDFKTEEII